ncbi:MAG: hypothetical protein K2J62_08190 [Bacteroidales bacterium]|nr:hypothetical protein [Bacteroidales bacterium]
MSKQVNDSLKEICRSLGYEKKGDFYIKPFSSNIYLTIRFSIASYRIKGHRLVAPMIGVRYEDVEKILQEISPDERLIKSRNPNTISEHIGYIMPIDDWKEWDFIEHGNTPEFIINDLREALQKYSIEYCKRFLTIDDIIAKIESEAWNPSNYSLFRRLPILYYLTGYKQKGIKFINRVFKEGFSEADLLFTNEYISNYMKLPDNPHDIK